MMRELPNPVASSSTAINSIYTALASKQLDGSGHKYELLSVKIWEKSYLILFCSVKSPSLTNIADSNRSVEFADFDWLFFIPKSQRTRSLIA